MALLIEAGQMTASDYVPTYPDLLLASGGASTDAILGEVRKEPGCLAYTAHVSRDAPGVIVMVEAWADQVALDTHAQAPAFTALAVRFGDLLAQPPTLERLQLLG